MIRSLFQGALLIASTVVISANDRAYLATVGPPELRFAPPRVSPSRPVLPPLIVRAAAPPTEVSPAPDTASASPIPAVPAQPVPGETAAIARHSASIPQPTEEALTAATSAFESAPLPQPQMFLHYFTPDYMAGSNFVSMALPIGFAPPQPRVSSSATYQVAPPPNP